MENNERTHIPDNIVKTITVGREYYYWDKVIGRVDEGLCEVLNVRDNIAYIHDLYNDQNFDVNINSLDWEFNPYDDVYFEGLEWLNSL